MKRRFAVRLLPLFALLVAAAARAAETAPAARPNIVWVVTEDNAATFVGGYGDPLARTPHFDRVAKDGILFERAYSTSAVCAPTRASIITGMFAPSLGTQHMRSNVPMPAWLRYFPAYLRDAGYFTTNRQKTDYNAAILPAPGTRTAHRPTTRTGNPASRSSASSTSRRATKVRSTSACRSRPIPPRCASPPTCRTRPRSAPTSRSITIASARPTA